MTVKLQKNITIKTTQKSVKTAEKTSKAAVKTYGNLQNQHKKRPKASQRAAQTTRAAAKRLLQH
jgi:hypothetical protein